MSEPFNRIIWAYVLYREISDQMGRDEVIGVYSTLQNAKEAAKMVRDRRTFVQAWEMDNIHKPTTISLI